MAISYDDFIAIYVLKSMLVKNKKVPD